MRVEPSKEIMYPDRGGYTGFSIEFWENPHDGKSHIFSSEFGGHRLEPFASEFVLEGRFFAFGKLISRVLEFGDAEMTLELQKKLYNGWKSIMDDAIKEMNKIEGPGISRDDIFSQEVVKKIILVHPRQVEE
jgi:hypothetical protein